MYTTAKRSLLIIIAVLGSIILLLPIATFAQNTNSRTHSSLTETTDFHQLLIPLITHTTFLPLVMTPPFHIESGAINLLTGDNFRSNGVTVFTSVVTLDFNDLHFSHPPVSMTISGSDIESSSLITFTITPTTRLINLTSGVKQINATFWYGDRNVSKEFVFFYIPNGDFHDNTIGAWTKTDGIIGIKESKLILGADVEPSACNNHKDIGADGISLVDIQLPSDLDYGLYVTGTVYTRDQNPSNNNTYDAFEILINENIVERYSNQDSPISCTREREISIDARIPLNNYSGAITLNLENHLRFDTYFNTYTEINMVWIDY